MKMKSIFAAAAITGIIFGSNTPITANQTVADVDKLYAKTLKTTSMETMKESILYCSVKLKAKYPDQKLKRIVRSIRREAKKGATANIRGKARLALEYLNHPDQFGCISEVYKTDCPELWAYIETNR